LTMEAFSEDWNESQFWVCRTYPFILFSSTGIRRGEGDGTGRCLSPPHPLFFVSSLTLRLGWTRRGCLVHGADDCGMHAVLG
jgi:hypothetical protein